MTIPFRPRLLLRGLERFGQLLAALAVLGAGLLAREPLPMVVEYRAWLLFGGLGLGLCLLVWLNRRPRGWLWWRWPIALLACAGLGLGLAREWRFQAAKRYVLKTDDIVLRKYGARFIVPCESLEGVRALITKGAVAGVFLRPRFTRGKSIQEARSEIAKLQSIRREHGLPPLFVTADQEGGLVSRLSPPLPQRPTIAEVADALAESSARIEAVTRFATAQGAELASLGVNVNFAPVVDLNFGVRSEADKYSLIYRRAISRDPAEVIRLAEAYVAGLARSNVTATLKHFPGLGRLAADTHLGSARLDAPRAELEANDWRPFREIGQASSAWVMVGHAKVSALDPDAPASVSARVIDLLRREWGLDSVLVTDDFCMGAISRRPGGAAKAAVDALNAGRLRAAKPR